MGAPKRKHLTAEWQRVRKAARPGLLARLPQPCARCGKPMVKGMSLDVAHISRNPALTYSRENLRLEHRSCNRRDGQRITTAIRNAKRKSKERPAW